MIVQEHNLESCLQDLMRESKDSSKIVLALSEIETWNHFEPILQKFCREFSNLKILSLNYFLSKHLESKQIPHDNLAAKKMSRAYEHLNDDAQQLAQTWYKDPENGTDFVTYKGLKLGYCLELFVYHFFQAVLRIKTDLEEYLQREAPETVVFFNSGPGTNDSVEPGLEFNLFEKLVPEILNQKEVNAIAVDCPLKVVSNQGKGLRKWCAGVPVMIAGMRLVFPRFVFSILKLGYLLFRNILTNLFCNTGKPKVLLASATSASYLGQPLLKYLVESDKFSIQVWNGESRVHGVTNVIADLSLKHLAKFFRKKSLRKRLLLQFEKDKESLSNSTVFEGYSIANIFLEFFKSLYADYFPALVEHATTLDDWLKENRANLLLAHTDHAMFERMSFGVARNHEIPGISFQHGLEVPVANTKIGYPSVAEYHFVWGQVNKDFRMKRNVPASQIIITGCPLHTNIPSSQSELASMKSPGTWLFICHSGGQGRVDNRLSFDDNERMLRSVLKIMHHFPEKKLIIKPRFHDVQVRVYEAMISEFNCSNAEIIMSPIDSLLIECDLFFCVYSTAALEGLLMDKPGIQFIFSMEGKEPLLKSSGTQLPPLGKYEANLSLVKDDPQALKQLIERIYTSETDREKMEKGRKRFINEFAGLNQGNPLMNFASHLESCLKKY